MISVDVADWKCGYPFRYDAVFSSLLQTSRLKNVIFNCHSLLHRLIGRIRQDSGDLSRIAASARIFPTDMVRTERSGSEMQRSCQVKDGLLLGLKLASSFLVQ